jgi:hypothetical protein
LESKLSKETAVADVSEDVFYKEVSFILHDYLLDVAALECRALVLFFDLLWFLL